MKVKEAVYVSELVCDEGDLLWDISFMGKVIASTHDRRQVTLLTEAVNRPVRWLVPA
jgi:hypothetical protein